MGCNWDADWGGCLDDFGDPCYTCNPVYVPPSQTGVTITGGGGTYSQGNLNLILASILSGLAIFQHQPYVPTTIQPQQPQPIIYQQPLGGGGLDNRGRNFGSSFQKLVEDHPGIIAGGAIAVLLFVMKPPTRSR